MLYVENGKRLKVRILSDSEFCRMEENGWSYISVSNEVRCMGAQGMHDFFIAEGYEKVRVYEFTTSIRGYYKIGVMVK